MSVIESTTGHSRTKEKNIARILYISIGAAIVVGVIIALLAGRNDASLDPRSSDNVEQVAPDLGAPPTNPGSSTETVNPAAPTN